MKKILVVLAIAAFASTASAMITNSKHDLTFGRANATLGSCSYCHAPHLWKGTNVNVTTGAPPLWNRNVANPTGYTIWPSTYFPVQNPGTRSLTCLSCHDGATDLGAVNNGAQDNLGFIADVAKVGTNLQDDHPVGVAISGSELNTPTFIKGKGVRLAYDTANTTYYVECNACHDPHNTNLSYFLRVDQKTLCAACHLK